MSLFALEDALRPTDESFKAFYERGFRTWHECWENVPRDPTLPSTCLQWEQLYPRHPILPVGLETDESGLAIAKSIWVSSNKDKCRIPEVEQTIQLRTAFSRPITTVLTDSPGLSLTDWFGKDDRHLVVLMLAWAYALSARWTEIVSRASPMHYTSTQAPWTSHAISTQTTKDDGNVVVELGSLNDDAARWWAAVLAPGQGWKAAIPNKRWNLFSPWSVTIDPQGFNIALTGSFIPESHHPSRPASFKMALDYISQYSAFHQADIQNRAALSAALLLPLANWERRKILLHIPRDPNIHSTGRHAPGTSAASFPTEQHLRQLDKLLTLSLNAHGMQAVLGSIFYEPEIPANICGAWLQGTIAALHTKGSKNLHVLASMFFHRAPQISFLWLGGFITGAHNGFLRNTFGLLGLNRIDLHEAAWTGTLMSFIQEAPSKIRHDSRSISRADECRLMFRAQEPPRSNPPIYPYPPWGGTKIKDTDLGVQLHAHCSGIHDLKFLSITWRCIRGVQVKQTTGPISAAVRNFTRSPQNHGEIVAVDYQWLDREKDLSEGVTSNLFIWMRDVDGHTVDERDIYRHEWLDGYESDDESVHPEGDGASIRGKDLDARMGRWMLTSLGQRRNMSI